MILLQVLPKNEIFRQTLFANFGSLSVDRKYGFGRNRKFTESPISAETETETEISVDH